MTTMQPETQSIRWTAGPSMVRRSQLSQPKVGVAVVPLQLTNAGIVTSTVIGQTSVASAIAVTARTDSEKKDVATNAGNADTSNVIARAERDLLVALVGPEVDLPVVGQLTQGDTQGEEQALIGETGAAGKEIMTGERGDHTQAAIAGVHVQ